MRLFILLIMISAAASQAKTIEEIVVNADLRRETPMQLGSSVTVVTDEAIRSRAAQHFEDIIQSIPNINYAAGSNRARFFQIRGIGERSQFVNPINPSIGVLIDDVDFSGAGAIATMLDIAQVEVLRGPQGTRYGANALGGLINISSNAPNNTRLVKLQAGIAEYGTSSLGLIANAPLSDSVNARLAVQRHKSDGYIDNDFLERDDTNGRDEQTVRTKFKWQTTDKWQIDLSIAKVDIDNGYDAFSLNNTRHTLTDEPGFDRQDTTYVSAKSTWRLDQLDIELLINGAESDIRYGYDEDWTFTGFHPWGYTSTDHYLRDRSTRSAEVRILSNDESRIFADSSDWVLGIYMLQSKESLDRNYTFATPFASDYDFNTIAIFGQIDSQLSSGLLLSTGLRFEERDTHYKDSSGARFSPRDHLWGGKIALEYSFSKGALAYASISRGYKAGGFNTDGSLDEDLREFGEEYLIEYELGYKTLLMDGDIALQAALFYDDRQDQQIKSSLVRVRPDNSAEFIDFFANAAEGTNRGLEIDIRWAVTDTLELSINAGWLDAEFDDFVNEFGEDLSGRDQAHAPGHMYSLMVNWQNGPWSASLSIDAKDDFYFSDRHDVKNDNYTLVNASLTYSSDNWRVMAWGRNLADKDYFVRAFGSFGNDPRKFYVTEPYFQFGEPRVIGLTLELTVTER